MGYIVKTQRIFSMMQTLSFDPLFVYTQAVFYLLDICIVVYWAASDGLATVYSDVAFWLFVVRTMSKGLTWMTKFTFKYCLAITALLTLMNLCVNLRVYFLIDFIMVSICRI